MSNVFNNKTKTLKVDHLNVQVGVVSDFLPEQDNTWQLGDATHKWKRIAAASINAGSATPPATPLKGDIWFDTSTNHLKVYDGTNWDDITGRLDSDSAWVQQVNSSLEQLLDSEYASRMEHVAKLIARLDSDTDWVQYIQTEVQNLLDSEYVKNAEMLAYVKGRLDSDQTAIQANLTTLENRIDSETAKNSIWFARIDQELDSDQAAFRAYKIAIDTAMDSEYTRVNTILASSSSGLSARLNADSDALATFKVAVDTAMDSEYSTRVARDLYILAMLDSESTQREARDAAILVTMDAKMDSEYARVNTELALRLKSVNGIVADSSGNVAVSLAKVITGTDDGRYAVSSPTDGTVYIVSGDSDANSDGRTYIYDSDNLVWRAVATADMAANDARYINTSGDTMVGALLLPEPAVPSQAATKNYVDSLDSEITVKLARIDQELDSDQAALAAFKVAVDTALDSEYAARRAATTGTPNRVPYYGTNGELTSEAALTYAPDSDRLTAVKVAATSFVLGNWTIELSGTDLVFKNAGTSVLKLTSAGALTVVSDVNANGTI